MLTVIYDPLDGLAMPDARVETYVYENFCNGIDGTYITSNALMINCIRVYVAEGQILLDDIRIVSKSGEDLKIKQDGSLQNWPRDCMMESLHFCRRLLQSQGNSLLSKS